MRTSRVALACCLLVATAAWTAAAERHVVSFAEGQGDAVEAELTKMGMTVVQRGPGFFSVVGSTTSTGQAAGYAAAKEAATVMNHARTASGISAVTGVTRVEVDRARMVWDGDAAGNDERLQAASGGWLGGAQGGPAPPKECSAYDETDPYAPFPEVSGFFLKQVQANSPKLEEAVPTTNGRGVLVCVIDSGVDRESPEFTQGPTELDGCKEEDDQAPAGCPFKWYQDITGHGTHVSGIIAAPRNGEGMVGVIPGGADLYMVRIFNDSGDVNQGQGFVYGASLILAYTQCEGKLAFLRASQPDKKWRMVISMSVGAPGPLTIEKMYFDEVSKREDMLFIASAGNNGTDDNQWLNYPSAYKGVISVGAVNCRNEIQPWSQKNARVDIVAPGSNILSSYVPAKNQAAGQSEGYLAYGSLYLNRAVAAVYSGVGTFKGAPLVDCGYGDKPCPEAKGLACLIQTRPLNESEIEAAAIAGAPAPSPLPSACSLAKFCLEQGAKAVILVPPKFIPGLGPFPIDAVVQPSMDCSIGGRLNCSCWDELRTLWAAGKAPPVVAVSIDMAAKLKKELASSKNATQPPHVFIQTRVAKFKRMSGTSMATPVVSGIAARIWANFPDCTAADVREAMFTTAMDLGKRGYDKVSGHGLVQAQDAYDWLADQPCGLSSIKAQQERDRLDPTRASSTWQKATAQPVLVPDLPGRNTSSKSRGPQVTWRRRSEQPAAGAVAAQAPSSAAAPPAAAAKKAPAKGAGKPPAADKAAAPSKAAAASKAAAPSKAAAAPKAAAPPAQAPAAAPKARSGSAKSVDESGPAALTAPDGQPLVEAPAPASYQQGARRAPSSAAAELKRFPAGTVFAVPPNEDGKPPAVAKAPKGPAGGPKPQASLRAPVAAVAGRPGVAE